MEIKCRFHACAKTTTFLKVDDDDDIDYNTLNLNTNDNQFHEINLKNKENIFIYSEKESLYLAKCSIVKAISIPKMGIKICNEYLLIKYYEEGILDHFQGYLQHNLIIRSDSKSLDIDSETCLKRDEIFVIESSKISHKSNGEKDKNKYEETIQLLPGEISSVSLKELSKFKNIFERFNEECGYKVFSFLENIGVGIIFIGACLGSICYYLKRLRENYNFCQFGFLKNMSSNE